MYSGEIIAGGQPRDFAVVRHVRLGGSQRDIGHHIAELARPIMACARSLARIRQ